MYKRQGLAGTGKRVLEVGLRRSDAEAVSQILFFRDVTHETEVDRMKSEFLSHAAHELRTPMASIAGFAELLATRKYSDERRQDVVGIIRRQSSVMVSIINELLDLVRIDDRRGQDFEFAPLDLRALVQEVLTDFGVPAGRESATLPQQALLYRLCADRNPLHADPLVARAVGFERPILHGLCTYGIAGRVLLALRCGHEPRRLQRLHARFSAPVMPGERLRVELFDEAATLRFRVLAVQRGRLVLDHGEARIAA